VLFENAFSQATKTRPSVPSLFTSLYPTATGVWWFWESLGDNYLTLAEVLRSQGFETAAFIQNPNAGPAAGLHQGFDRNFFAGKAGDIGSGKIYGHKVYDWIEQNKDRNFFLYLHVADPHGPYSPPEPFDAWYRNSGGGSTPVIYDDIWDPEWISAPTKEGRRALYDGEVRHNDMLFESLVQTLRDLSIFEDTLIIFLSDHGENLGERGQWDHQPPGFTQGVRVPLIMHYPNGLPKGKRISAPAQILDVMPTILELAGISSEKIPLQGRSLMPRIDGPPSGIFDMPLVWIDEVTRYTVKTIETSSQKLLVGGELFGSVVFGDWHIMITVPPAPNRLVFNYANDPQEEDDRFSRLMQWYIDDFVEPVMRKHQDLSMAIFEHMSAGAELKEIILTPESEKILRALGYIE
jgi:arylsulfatase A-like enzyme